MNDSSQQQLLTVKERCARCRMQPGGALGGLRVTERSVRCWSGSHSVPPFRRFDTPMREANGRTLETVELLRGIATTSSGSLLVRSTSKWPATQVQPRWHPSFTCNHSLRAGSITRWRGADRFSLRSIKRGERFVPTTASKSKGAVHEMQHAAWRGIGRAAQHGAIRSRLEQFKSWVLLLHLTTRCRPLRATPRSPRKAHALPPPE